MFLYSSTAITVPLAEFYMVYTGTRRNVPEVLHFSDLCSGEGSIEVTVKVLRGGDSSILGQYVDFCKIAGEQRELYGLTRKAIQETIRICLERGILVPFLTSRREEVIDIMEMLFNQEEVREMERRHIARESRQEGVVNGILLALRGLIETTGMSIEEALAALKIPESDQYQYIDLLRNSMP